MQAQGAATWMTTHNHGVRPALECGLKAGVKDRCLIMDAMRARPDRAGWFVLSDGSLVRVWNQDWVLAFDG